MSAIRFLSTTLISLLCIFTLSACRSAPATSPPVPGMSFNLTGDECPSMEITAGDTVTWTNQTQDPRQMTGQAPDQVSLFDSGVLNQDDTFSFTFTQAGTYSYTCWLEQDAAATITVLP